MGCASPHASLQLQAVGQVGAEGGAHTKPTAPLRLAHSSAHALALGRDSVQPSGPGGLAEGALTLKP